MQFILNTFINGRLYFDRDRLILIFLLLLLLSLCSYFLYRAVRAIRIQNVENGEMYNALLDLNRSMSFRKGIEGQYVFRVDLNTKQQFDHFDPWGYMRTKVDQHSEEFLIDIDHAEENWEIYGDYVEEVAKILRISPEDVCNSSINDSFEVRHCKTILLHPVTYVEYIVVYTYTSPAGRNYYEDREVFSEGDIFVLLDEAENIKKAHETAAYQRSRMTPGLRYEVLKRDHFRCRLCGRTADDGVKLHVDHIRPVSKGGKTELDNLRTLCDECNLGKSDKYTPGEEN